MLEEKQFMFNVFFVLLRESNLRFVTGSSLHHQTINGTFLMNYARRLKHWAMKSFGTPR